MMRESLQRVGAVIWLQWKPTLRPMPGGNPDRTAFWYILVPIMAFGASFFAVSGYFLASLLVQNPLYVSCLLMGFGGLTLGAFLLLLFFDQNPSTGMDASRLFHLPLRPAEILASQVVGNVLNPMLLFGPLGLTAGCAAAAAAGGHILLAACCLVSLPLWLVQFSVIVMVADFALFYLRRSKALSRIALLLSLATVLSLFLAVLSLNRETGVNPEDSGLWQSIAWLWETASPALAGMPGFSPFGWVGLTRGWPRVLAASFLETALLYALGSWMLGRLMSQSAGESIRARAARRQARDLGRTGPLERLPFWPYLAKDIRLLWRERAFKVVLCAVGILLLCLPEIVMGISEGNEPFGPVSLADLMHWLGPLVLVGLMNSLTLNQLGLEGAGILLFFASPAPRWRFIAGKNLALFALASLPLGAYEGMLLVYGARWLDVFSDCLFALGLAFLFFGAGNFASILWPRPFSFSGKAKAAKTSVARQLITSLYQSLLMATSLWAAVPLFAGRYALSKCESPGALFALVGIATFLYGAIAYVLALSAAGWLLSRLEPRIFERLVRGA